MSECVKETLTCHNQQMIWCSNATRASCCWLQGWTWWMKQSAKPAWQGHTCQLSTGKVYLYGAPILLSTLTLMQLTGESLVPGIRRHFWARGWIQQLALQHPEEPKRVMGTEVVCIFFKVTPEVGMIQKCFSFMNSRPKWRCNHSMNRHLPMRVLRNQVGF